MPSRIIKESVCTSTTLDGISAEAERLFYRLIVQCDDYGRMDGRLAVIASKCFPLKRTLTEADVGRWMDELSRADLLHAYAVDSRPYLQIATWARHQQIRAEKSKFPEMPKNAMPLVFLPSPSFLPSIDINRAQIPSYSYSDSYSYSESKTKTESSSSSSSSPSPSSSASSSSATGEERMMMMTDLFSRNVKSPVTDAERTILSQLAREAGDDLVSLAIMEGARHAARNVKYIERIVRNWLAQGVTTLEQAKENIAGWEGKKREREKELAHPAAPTPPRARLPGKEVAEHRYGQREYKNGELDHLLVDIMSADPATFFKKPPASQHGSAK